MPVESPRSPRLRANPNLLRAFAPLRETKKAAATAPASSKLTGSKYHLETCYFIRSTYSPKPAPRRRFRIRVRAAQRGEAEGCLVRVGRRHGSADRALDASHGPTVPCDADRLAPLDAPDELVPLGLRLGDRVAVHAALPNPGSPSF